MIRVRVRDATCVAVAFSVWAEWMIRVRDATCVAVCLQRLDRIDG
jgi:hypothetical protein